VFASLHQPAPLPRRAYSYKVITAPAELPVSLATVKAHLRIDPSNTTEDALITLYIQAATSFAEEFTRRHFITREIETFRDFFPAVSDGYYKRGVVGRNVINANVSGGNLGFELRRSPLQSIESVEHLVDGSFVAVDPTVFYATFETDYSELLSQPDQCWPDNTDNVVNQFEFGLRRGLATLTLTCRSGYR